jgi:hypothetical protein
MTSAAHVPACAMLLEENWNRFSSCSVTDLSKPRSVTWALVNVSSLP